MIDIRLHIPLNISKKQITMTTKNRSLKQKTFQFAKILLFAICFSYGTVATAQTGVYNIIQQPCNNDGILAMTITSGLSAPLDFYFYDVNGSSIVHSNINALTDTLFGITTAIASVYVTPTAAPWSVYYYTAVSMVPPFTVDAPIISHAVCPSLTGTAQLTINGGTSPSSVQWYVSGGWSGLGAFVGTGNPMTLSPGSYSSIITDASGCIVTTGLDSTAALYIDNISGINFSITTTLASCTNGTATITGITGGMAPYTYLWSNGASTNSIASLPMGLYSATVTDAQGCNQGMGASIGQSITIGANPVTTSATCTQNDGAVISFGSGGTPPYTYSYSNGMSGQSITGLSGGTSLSVTATDANGCIGTDYFYIGITTPISVTYSAIPSSCTAPTGSATLALSGGTSPYLVNWNITPATMGIFISSIGAGTYAFTVTDAVGCVQTGVVSIAPVSAINATSYASNPVCPATIGSAGVNVTGTNPPFTYLWSTGATSSWLPVAPVGSYSCIITDNVGCTQTKYSLVTPTNSITIGYSTTPASCLYTADGSILANAIGGTAPYSYTWSNGQTGPNAIGLQSDNYWVSVIDANGCVATAGTYTFVGYDPANTSCYCTITGNVYSDANSNCIHDSGEQGIDHIMIHCSGFGYAFTDVNGDYSFNVPTGSYTLSESVQYAYPLAACQSNSIPVSVTAATGCNTNVDFANTVNTIRDIHITRTNINFAIPGNSYTQGLIVQNDGTVNESTIQLGYRSDGQINYVNTTPVAYAQLSPAIEPNWYSVTSGSAAMAPGTSSIIYFNDLVPTNIPLATTLLFSDSASYAAPMNNWLNDYTPWNNVGTFQTTVVGSYDPNFKEVSPAGTGVEGFITTADSALDYIIHFQNTGSYYANKVVVVDTLDMDLNWESLRLGYSDHAYTATLSESGILTFTFDNIHLTWQADSEMGSRGLVAYSIKQNSNLAVGTEIKNKAAIYFDYNEPVITNETLNTITEPQGITDEQEVSSLVVYPNPTTGDLNIDLGNAENTTAINIYDLQGRLIMTTQAIKNASTQRVSVSHLVNGIYFIELVKEKGLRSTGKFIKN